MRIVSMLALIAIVLPSGRIVAQQQSNGGALVIWPSGAPAFPTGRFGEKDEVASPPKDGNETGYNAGVDVGYFISDFASIGVNYSMGRFDLDVAEIPGFHHTGHTGVWTAEAWGRFFLRGGYERWQPYLFAGVGVGRPKGTLEFNPPTDAFHLPDEVTTLESTVDLTSTISGGIGVLVPVSNAMSLSFEPRYNSVNSKGTARSDLVSQANGSQVEAKEDPQGNRLKAKSNTNWWEIRVGVVFLLRR